jgi:hypothetical protein
MARQRTEQQRIRDERDREQLREASWVLRRLVDQNFFHGTGATLYAVCELMDRAALDVPALDRHLRSCLLGVARSARNDARHHRGPAEPSG